MFRSICRVGLLSIVALVIQCSGVLADITTHMIKVRGAENDRSYGQVMFMPDVKNWPRTQIRGMGITVEVPCEVERVQLQRSPVHIYKSSLNRGALDIGFYPVYSNFGALPAAEIELLIVSTANSVESHELVVSDPVSWQRQYSRVLKLEDGRTLQISGRIHKYFEAKSGRSLFEEMDADVRRAIGSVQLSKEAIPANQSLQATPPR